MPLSLTWTQPAANSATTISSFLADKKVIIFSVPGAFTPTATYNKVHSPSLKPYPYFYPNQRITLPTNLIS